jgi:hypothetical protein
MTTERAAVSLRFAGITEDPPPVGKSLPTQAALVATKLVATKWHLSL